MSQRYFDHGVGKMRRGKEWVPVVRYCVEESRLRREIVAAALDFAVPTSLWTYEPQKYDRLLKAAKSYREWKEKSDG